MSTAQRDATRGHWGHLEDCILSFWVGVSGDLAGDSWSPDTFITNLTSQTAGLGHPGPQSLRPWNLGWSAQEYDNETQEGSGGSRVGVEWFPGKRKSLFVLWHKVLLTGLCSVVTSRFSGRTTGKAAHLCEGARC